MNLKKNFVRFICLTLVMCIFLPLISCKKEGPSTDTENNGNDNKIYTTNAKNNELAAYGNYVFHEFNGIFRYNIKTGKNEKACRDVECDGNCPLESMSTITGVYDGKLYFYAVQAFTHKVYVAYQDILSGEVKALKVMEETEDSGNISCYVEGEYIYYERMILKNGGDKTNPDDYELHICRVSLDGKKDEIFIKCGEKEGLVMACDGNVIIGSEGDLYSIDIETKEKRLLFDCDAYDVRTGSGQMKYVDGKIYISKLSNYNYISEITGGEWPQQILFSVDLNTGEVKKVLEEPIVYFCVTDDAVYYVPFKYRILYMPEDYENNKDDLKIWSQDYTVYACDLDGNNIRAVYSNDQISYTSMISVFDGVLYGYTSEYLEDEYTYGSKVLFTSIDLETGEIVRMKRAE